MKNLANFFALMLALCVLALSLACAILTPPDVQTQGGAEEWRIISYAVAGLLFLALIAWVARGIIKSGYAVPIFGILFGLAVVIGVLSAYYYGDKNGDGKADVMTVRMIQPTGTDAQADAAYANVNGENSLTNLKSAASGAIYAAIIWGTVIVFVAAWVIISARKGA
jgi:hypothetical protein